MINYKSTVRLEGSNGKKEIQKRIQGEGGLGSDQELQNNQ